MKLRICNCDRWCKIGRKSSHWQARIKNKIKSFRSENRHRLRSGDYEKAPVEVRVGHTD